MDGKIMVKKINKTNQPIDWHLLLFFSLLLNDENVHVLFLLGFVCAFF